MALVKMDRDTLVGHREVYIEIYNLCERYLGNAVGLWAHYEGWGYCSEDGSLYITFWYYNTLDNGKKTVEYETIEVSFDDLVEFSKKQ